MNRKIVWFRLPYYKTVGGWINLVKKIIHLNLLFIH